MSGKAVSKSKKPVLQHARELPNDAQLEQGDNWFAVATSWWDQFQAAPKAKDAPSVRNDSLIDKQLSSKTRKVSILKPKLEEGADFVFVPEASWEVIARGLDFDWEIRREVIYQRSQQMLQIEPYPFAFKIFSWTADETEPVELVDDAGREVVVLGSRNHSLGQVLSEVWLAAPVEFHRQFPELLGSVDPICSSLKSLTTASDDQQIRVCYHSVRAIDGTMEWMPIEKMQKRTRTSRTSLRLKRRAKKRQEREKEASCDERSSDESEAEFDVQLKEDHPEMNVKLGDLRLDKRSEVASGSARLHELLIEQKPKGDGDMGWPTQGRELQWRMTLAKGDLLDALDTSREWFEARLLAARRNKVHVHYRSWETKWDEWISRTSPRLAPPYSRVPRWRSALPPHSLVQVGLEVPRLKHTKWRNATVIEVVPTTDVEAQGNSDGVGLRVHVQVDDDDIWLPAHDDLLCRSNTHNESSPLTKRERRLLSHDDSLASETIEEAAEEAGEDEEEYEVVEADGDEQDSDDPNLMDHEGPSSPPPRATNAAELAAASRAARSLSTSFTEVEDRRQSSAGRTPGQAWSRGQSQVSSNDTSPEPVSPAPRADRSNSRELRTMWAQMSRDLQALQASWTQLGEGLFAAVEGRERDEG
ncbi:hypothetical protein Pcac1_g5344 [Phytophthora cactorum]|uniref:DUSP domain-containing protein n=4 Tax=Phytophthora cactorum TaxID=29920 RepID=A0A329RH63_9STRA|nr:Chromo domain-like [Phytophthora cactorum]KAG2785069.1 hypothetical protein Pcac1_g5344 [Phytophthora cactorum]RAW24055.1 hypothetical protein PC110_g19514 [Phytophthora cactorum]